MYHAIDPATRMVSTEVIGMPAAPGAASLVTVALAPAGEGTALAVTLQSVSLGTDDMLAEVRDGWEGALTNLDGYLAR